MQRRQPDWRAVRALVLDVDGVLTPRQIVLHGDGGDVKFFSVRDGRAVKSWIAAGRPAALLSARQSPATARRAGELGIEVVVQGCADKDDGYQRIRLQLGVSDEAVCYLADDRTDLRVLSRVGLPVAVADADPLVRLAALYVTDAPGGDGAVCEVVERLMRRQGLPCPRDAWRTGGWGDHAGQPARAGGESSHVA